MCIELAVGGLEVVWLGFLMPNDYTDTVSRDGI